VASGRLVFHESALRSRLSSGVGQAQKALDLQVMKDCDPYVPADTLNLANTARRATDVGSGEIVWEGPYAAKQYYELPHKSRDRHPLAVTRWFEHAKAARKAAWIRVAKKAGGER
jgi:hypothetical protein